MEWNGIEWNENGMKWNEIEYNLKGWNEMEWDGIEWNENGMELQWSGMKWIIIKKNGM